MCVEERSNGNRFSTNRIIDSWPFFTWMCVCFSGANMPNCKLWWKRRKKCPAHRERYQDTVNIQFMFVEKSEANVLFWGINWIAKCMVWVSFGFAHGEPIFTFREKEKWWSLIGSSSYTIYLTLLKIDLTKNRSNPKWWKIFNTQNNT